MAESNAEWGELQAHDSEMAEVWDGFERLPDPGQNPALDALVASKGITIDALVRLGAKLTEPGGTVLAFAWDGGIKYRDVVTGKRWTYLDSDFSRLKIIRAEQPSTKCIVAEGETDAARLTMAYPEVDVGIMGGGAKYVTEAMVGQLADYDMVLVALDADAAGEAGAAKLTERLLNAQRFLPPAEDWCASAEADFPLLPDELERRPELELIVWGGELLNYEMPDVVSYFEQALLPIGGQLILHGWTKGFKSFQALDLLAALAQGRDWCGFEPTEEPVRVTVMQYEIPPAYFQQRYQLVRKYAPAPDLLDMNFGIWTPLQRPSFRAGNTKYEDAVLRALVDNDVQVFMLDPVRRAMRSRKLNESEYVGEVLGFFERLQNEGIAVVAVHHDNKEGARAGGGDPVNMTGAGDWAGDADTLISVSIPKGMKMQDPKRNLTFTLRNAPSIGDRGMEIDEDGKITYSLEPYGDWGDEPDSSAELPPI